MLRSSATCGDEVRVENGLKTSYRYRFLFVPIWPNGLAIKDSTANPLDFVIIKSMFEPL